MTKIDIISGFLGAGKTTLIKKLLEEVYAGEKVVLVENEYGEVGIDGGFMKDSGIQVQELNSGCICCTLVGDFEKNLKEVLETYAPDRILIEPSGVGKLSDVMAAVKTVEEGHDAKLNALITVANAKKFIQQQRSFGEFFNDQLANATTIVLSRTQQIPDAKVESVAKKVREINPKAAIITTPWDDLQGEQIISTVNGQQAFMDEMMAELEAHHHEHHHDHDHHHDHEEHHILEDGSCSCGHDHHHHDHHADEVFDSWGKETPHKYTKEKMEEILSIFRDSEDYGDILRAKGMVPAEDGTWIYFDMVPGDFELREGQPDVIGRLCVIGTDLNYDELEKLFELV